MSVQALSPVASAMPERRVLLRLWLGRLLWVFAALLLWGCAAVFSTTVYQRISLDRPPYTDFLQHLQFVGFGLALSVLLIIAARWWRPVQRWARYVIPALYVLSLTLVAMVSFSSFGREVFGARIVLDLGFVRFQPSELMKLTTVMYLAMLLCWWRDMAGLDNPERRHPATGVRKWLRYLFKHRNGRPYWPDLPRRVVLVLLLPVGLAVLQKDLGAAALIFGMGLITILLAGVDWRQLVLSALLLAVLGCSFVLLKPSYLQHASSRLEVYRALLLNQPVDQDGEAFQITQSRGALALGGLTGRGYLHSEQKMNRLPVCTKDFVFPIMVEEFGYLGGLGIMLLFLAVAWCGINLANACTDPFNRSVVGALGLGLCMQAYVNIGTTLGTLPVTGITLPFFSEGGSSIVVSILAIATMSALSLTEIWPQPGVRPRQRAGGGRLAKAG